MASVAVLALGNELAPHDLSKDLHRGGTILEFAARRRRERCLHRVQIPLGPADGRCLAARHRQQLPKRDLFLFGVAPPFSECLRRSDERRVVKEWGSTCSYRWGPSL